jgi:arylsulfatase
VQAGQFYGLPLDDRTAIEILATPRPQMTSPRDHYIYYPNTLEVPEAVAVNVRGRSFMIAAEVDIQSSGAGGLIFAHGSKFGGHALYIKDGKLKYVYDYLGEGGQVVESKEKIPTGTRVLGVEFSKESQTPEATTGSLSLYIDSKKVGELENVKTQNGRFSLCGEGLNIGRDGGENVTDDYPGDRPWPFVGGTIKQVIVDVSGEPYLDLEKEAMAMLSRE